MLAGALISGSLHLHTISEEGVSSLSCVEVFPGASLRALAFPSAHSSEVVLAASSEGDLALVAVETGQVSSRLPTAHDGSLTCARPLNGSMVACGTSSEAGLSNCYEGGLQCQEVHSIRISCIQDGPIQLQVPDPTRQESTHAGPCTVATLKALARTGT